MGAPISSFSVFREIARGQRQSFRGLNAFNLYAIILHNPEKHRSFHKYVESNLHRLDAATRGASLIFFTLVKPTDDFREIVRRNPQNRSYLIELEALRTGEGVSNNNDASVFLLSKDLNIPEEALPCIVVTNDLSSDKVFWMNTNPTLLHGQLAELQVVANMHDRSDIMSAVQRNPEFHWSNLAAKSLASAMSEALAFNIRLDDSEGDSYGAKSCMRNKWKEISNDLSAIKEQFLHSHTFVDTQDDIDKFEQFRRYEEYLVQTTEKLFARIPGPLPDNWDEIRPHLEHRSFKFLKSGLKVLEIIKGAEDLDFSGAVMPLGKAFENEVNRSAVQWVRHYYGIPMPQFYCKYAPDFRVEGLVDEYALNKPTRNGSWSPLPIGRARVALESIGLIPPGFTTEEFSEFNNLWILLNGIRNKAGHSMIVNEGDAAEMVRLFKNLREKMHFRKLSNLRSMMKRGNTRQ